MPEGCRWLWSGEIHGMAGSVIIGGDGVFGGLGFTAGLIEQSGKLITQAVILVGRRVGFAERFAELGGKGESLAGVGEAELVQIVLIHALDIAFGDVEDGFGEGELAVAKGPGAGGGIEEIGAMQGAFGLGGLFGGAGVVGLNATAPVEVAGPAFDGALGGTDFSGGSRQATARAELEIGAEGGEGAAGFALNRGEDGIWQGPRTLRRNACAIFNGRDRNSN